MLPYRKRYSVNGTKPDLHLGADGICDAFPSYERRTKVERDCIVRVSGGKGSNYKGISTERFSLNPLSVTSSTCHLTKNVRKNIRNLKYLGVDCVEESADPVVCVRLKASASAIAAASIFHFTEQTPVGPQGRPIRSWNTRAAVPRFIQWQLG